MKTLLLAIEKAKANIRAKVEPPFHVIKKTFGYRKVRYKGLPKNRAHLFSLFGPANLVLAGRCQGYAGGASVLNLAGQSENPAAREIGRLRWL